MKYLLATLLGLFLMGCGNDQKTPDYLWEEDRFINVLTEFQLAESYVRLGYNKKKDTLIIKDSIYQAVFYKMDVSKQEFDSNFHYYMRKPKQMEKIYDQVMIDLSERSAEISGKKSK